MWMAWEIRWESELVCTAKDFRMSKAWVSSAEIWEAPQNQEISWRQGGSRMNEPGRTELGRWKENTNNEKLFHLEFWFSIWTVSRIKLLRVEQWIFRKQGRLIRVWRISKRKPLSRFLNFKVLSIQLGKSHLRCRFPSLAQEVLCLDQNFPFRINTPGHSDTGGLQARLWEILLKQDEGLG